MSQISQEHRQQAPQKVRCAIITVSDTRTIDTDQGGALVAELLTGAGHQVTAREIIPDEPRQLAQLVMALARQDDVEAILLTGGTGISSRDQTCEAISGILTRRIPGYGELFRMLSYQEIGAAAMLSRAIGGLVNDVVMLTMPGSPAGVRLAMEKLILPELGHLVSQARR